MLDIEKVLCPVDFSDTSYLALETAGDLARQFGAGLDLVNVVSPLPGMPVPSDPQRFNVPAYEQQMVETNWDRLHEVREQLVPHELRSEAHVIIGRPADEIVRYAEKNNFDLIVMATRGSGGVRRALFGSVAERVVERATGAVLTVRGPSARSAQDGS